MTVKKITTLGCNPLLMLHKMADIGGLEILESESFERWGQTYYTRVIGRHSSGLYFEARDNVNATLGAGSERRFMFAQSLAEGSSPGTLLEAGRIEYFDKQEMTSTELARVITFFEKPSYNASNCFWNGIFAPDQPTLAASSDYTETVENIAISSLFRAVTSNGEFTTSLTSDNPIMAAGYGIIDPFGNLPNAAAATLSITSHVLSLGSTIPDGYKTLIQASAVRDEFVFKRPITCPSSGGGTLPTYYVARPILGVWSGNGVFASLKQYGAIPLLASGGVIRVALSVNGDGELNAPSEWMEFPVHCECMSTESGLWFINAGSLTSYAKASYSFVGVMDTSKGNNFGSGRAPVMMRRHMLSSGVNGTVAPYIRAIGANDINDGSAKTLSEYAPALPIGNDVYSGGPVVGNVFGYASDEVRGIFPDLLSCHTALPVGTSGWLDGKRYSVFRPGFMIRVG